MQRVMRTTLKWSESQQHVLSARATSWCVISARSAHSWMTPHSRSLRIAHNNVTMQMKRDNACRVGGMSARFHFVPPRNNPSVQLRMAAPAGPDVLKQYGRDLTEDARSGKLDPVIGRDESIRRCLQILSRRTKNNPILIGEPGVGKTAIAEGLARAIASGEVPESIQDKIVWSLDLASLVAGAKYRGEFEERVKGVLREIEEANGQIILFVDEVHLLVGAGDSQGGFDASQMLKPALARGQLRCMGATTLGEYRKYIEKDPALARRFQEVLVQEPTVPDTISILRGIKAKYEVHHGVRITDSALVAAATLSHRYLTTRRLPDKAIDLIDEAASRLRLQQESKPEPIQDIDRQVVTLTIEETALKKESDARSQQRTEEIREELAALTAQLEALTELWLEEKKLLNKAKQLKIDLEKAHNELEMVKQKQHWERAGELQHGVIPDLENELRDVRAQQDEKDDAMLSEQVSEKDIADVVGRASGIPVQRLMSGERSRLLRIEEELSKSVVGQTAAIAAVGSCVRRARAGLASANHPRGSFLFLGPTGVGKTELCKALSAFLFDDPKAMTRIDMSEYSEPHSVSRLVGAPPGYVGFEEGGTLTEAVRRRPFQVVLLDEYEKAHRKVSNILLQILDEGCLTDSHGRKVDMSNTMVILTSNIGSEFVANLAPGTDAASAGYRADVLKTVKQFMSAELLNRVDDRLFQLFDTSGNREVGLSIEILLFERLQPQHMPDIVDIQMRHASKQLAEQGLKLEVDQEVRSWLAAQGHNEAFGARPLQRLFTRTVINAVSEALLIGDCTEGDTIAVRWSDDRPSSAGDEGGDAGAGWQTGVVSGVVAEVKKDSTEGTTSRTAR